MFLQPTQSEWFMIVETESDEFIHGGKHMYLWKKSEMR